MAAGEWHCEKWDYLKNESFTKGIGNVPETGCLSIIVLSVSGDLAKKKTFPALFNLYRQILVGFHRWYTGEESRMLYAYDVINGFAAYLSPEEVKAMEKIPGFYLAKGGGLGSNKKMGFQKGKGVITTVSMSESMRKARSHSKTQEANLGEETNSSN
ncbi:unnamed protein product [Fraxinus pennsylvanica]|uniref:Inhibitor I9 domain-containing protein n=1 Tax=Fraxinus pennsylvanica TaxID=56036 RepID=A0AAD2AAA7_9LAMI|nr:unnamed protein product [Fraxinus pennsylvanica]